MPFLGHHQRGWGGRRWDRSASLRKPCEVPLERKYLYRTESWRRDERQAATVEPLSANGTCAPQDRHKGSAIRRSTLPTFTLSHPRDLHPRSRIGRGRARMHDIEHEQEEPWSPLSQSPPVWPSPPSTLSRRWADNVSGPRQVPRTPLIHTSHSRISVQSEAVDSPRGGQGA